LGVNLVHEQLKKVKMSELAVGGGRIRTQKNVDYINDNFILIYKKSCLWQLFS